MENCLYISKFNLKRENEFFVYNIIYPIIKLKNECIYHDKFDLHLINKINSEIYKDIMDFKNKVKIEAKEYKKMYNESITKHDKLPVKYKYEVYVNCDVTYDRNAIVSIPVTKYMFTGGAHGMTYLESYNYDLLTGEKLYLRDLFKENVDYITLVSDFIKEEIQKEPEKYFKGDEAFNKIDENQKFYIDDDGIVVYFPLYEISPYYVGIPKFKLKFKEFKDYLTYY